MEIINNNVMSLKDTEFIYILVLVENIVSAVTIFVISS